MIKKTVCGVIVFFVCFISILALTQPPTGIETSVPKENDIETVLGLSDLTAANSCDVSGDGFIKAYGGDSYLVFNDFEEKFQTVVVRFSQPAETSISAQLFYKNALTDYNEEMSVTAFCTENADFICFPVTASDELYTGIRIDIDNNYNFASVELHTEPADTEVFNIQRNATDYIVAILISTLFVIVLFSFDYKFSFIEQIFKFFSVRRKNILIGVIIFAASCIVAVGIEFLLGKFVYGLSSNGQLFNIYRYFFVCGIICLVVFLVACFKIIDTKFENVLLGVILIIGTTMNLITPAAHVSWDMDSHYKWVRNASYVGDVYFTEADNAFKYVKAESFAGDDLAENEQNMALLDAEGEKFISFQTGDTKISHRLSGILVAWARFFGASFTKAFIIGRFGNLIIYALVCYFAAKKLKSGKIILAIIALFPTNMLLATNYSYDYWVTCFMMLGMSYFISELQQPEKEITTVETIIMCGSMALACIPKQIYAPLMIIPFFMRKNKNSFTHKKRYYLICLVAICALMLSLFIRSISSVSGAGDLRGGNSVNPGEQISFIFSSPIKYTGILLNFLAAYLSPSGAKDYITHMAYLGQGVHLGLFLVLLAIAAVTDKNKYDIHATSWLLKFITIALFFGIAALMATALYIDFTPVGSTRINGCQGRYITPLLFPMISVIANFRKSCIFGKINRKVYNYAFIIPCVVMVMVSVYSVILTRMM